MIKINEQNSLCTLSLNKGIQMVIDLNCVKQNALAVHALAIGHAEAASRVASSALPKNGITGERQRTMEACFLVVEREKRNKSA